MSSSETSTFTVTNVVDMSKERDWPVALGMLDWDTTNIVFTKRTLIEFLKYTGTTVDTNFANIGKLPRYAKFGKMSSSAPEGTKPVDDSAEPDTFRPSRRVREAPGGKHTDIFDFSDVTGDALSLAPPPPESGVPHVAVEVATHQPPPEDDSESGIDFPSAPKPSRRVRTVPGGASSLTNFWDTDQAEEQFKPTRRVRQGPGGPDSVSQIF